MRVALIKVIGIFLLSAVCLFGEIHTLSEAIEISHRQSVLTQKILANYVMVGMHNRFQNPEQVFEESRKQFDANIEALDNYATSKKAFKNIEKITNQWALLQKIFSKKISRENAEILLKETNSLLALTKETTVIYTRQTGSMLGKIIDTSMSIGINAQRIGTLYLLKSWGIKVDTEMQKAMQVFEKSLKELKEEKINTSEIDGSLKKVYNDFMYFIYMNKLDHSPIPTLIYSKASAILKHANSLTQLYNKTITLN